MKMYCVGGVHAYISRGTQIAGFFTAIPDCVLGGMTTFLFANVAVSGIKILAAAGNSRRSRFITACSLGLGLGVTIAPSWATNNLWPCEDCGEALKVRTPPKKTHKK